MKILVTGAKGQLGNKIIEILGKKHRLVLTDSDNMDITDIEAVENTVKKEKPDYIIHAAAYTKVDKAEEEIDLKSVIESITLLEEKEQAIDNKLNHYLKELGL